MYERRIAINENLAQEIKQIASETGQSENKTIETAIAFYAEHYYLKNKATFIDDGILEAMKNISDKMETRLNNKTNQVLSELAIQVSIMEQVLGASIPIDGDVLSKFRQNAVEFLKINQRILRMDEVIE